MEPDSLNFLTLNTKLQSRSAFCKYPSREVSMVIILAISIEYLRIWGVMNSNQSCFFFYAFERIKECPCRPAFPFSPSSRVLSLALIYTFHSNACHAVTMNRLFLEQGLRARAPRARASLFATEKYTYTFMNGSGLDLEVIFSGFREFKLHKYSKRQTLDSNWEFLKKRKWEDKNTSNNSYG